MNLFTELQRRKIKPFQLTQEEFDRDFANIYSVMNLADRASPEELRAAIEAAICKYQLLQADSK